jgi:hypothetical protein
MQSRFPGLCRVTVPAAAILLWIGIAAAQQTEERPDQERAAHRARMKEVASSIQVYAAPGKKESQVKLAEDPVLRYSDGTRQTPESSLWIWGAKGRPTAILAIEYHADFPKGPSWLYEVASLAAEPIAAERAGSFAWTAKQPGLALTALPDAPVPAERPTRRLAQMKELRDRFTAHEIAMIGGRIELRPLASPLYRYDDAGRDVLDGAIFSFANGTNPEVLLVLEAGKSKDKEPGQWRYGLVQMAGAEVVVHLDDKQVWQRANADPPAVRASYVNGWILAEEVR